MKILIVLLLLGFTFEQDDKETKIELFDDENSLIDEMSKEIEKSKENQEYRNNVADIPQDFNLDKFLDEFGKHDCGTGELLEIDDPICIEKLKEQTFGKLANIDQQPDDFYKHIQNIVYKPLAIDFQQFSSFSELIEHMHNLPVESSLLETEPLGVNFKTFRDTIISAFFDINGKLSDVDGNKEAISQLVISILKKCHIYWNTLRLKNQLPKAIEDTKTLVENIAKVFLIRDHMLKTITEVVLKKISTAYKNFKKADSLLNDITQDGDLLIGEKLIRRYINMCDQIRRGIWSEMTISQQLSYIIDLFHTYLILSYYQNRSQPEIENLAKVAIINRIQQNYNEFYQELLKSSDVQVESVIKEFTAILLLKMIHSLQIVFRYNPITQFIVSPEADQYIHRELTVKVMIEFQDQFNLIPLKCENFFLLKECTMNRVNSVINYLASKYHLKTNVYGWKILAYLDGIIRSWFTDANDFVWQNYFVYKQYFYQHMFILMAYLVEHWHISSDAVLDLLSDKLTDVISQAYTELPHSNMKLYDIFDLQLYDKILDLRAEYNTIAHYSTDHYTLMQIQNQMFEWVNKFIKNNKSQISIDFLKFLKVIHEKILEWRKEILDNPEMSVRQNILPLEAKTLDLTIHHEVQSPNKQQHEDESENNPSEEDETEDRKLNEQKH